MNQKIILSGFLTLALISTGCSATTTNQSKASTQTAGTSQVASTTGTDSTSTDKSAATSGDTAKRSTIGKYGKVKKIIGNSVTIELAELPKRGEKSSTDTAKTTTNTETPPEGGPPAGEPPAGGTPPSGSSGGNGGGGNGGPPSGGSGSGSTGGSNGMKGGFGLSTEEVKLTGEVVELLIPVGVKITSAGTSGMKEIDFADIAQGDIIALYYAEGTENIERVVITPSSSN